MSLYLVGNCVISFDSDTGESIGLKGIDELQQLAIIDEKLIADAMADTCGQDLLNEHIDSISSQVGVEKYSVLVLCPNQLTYILYNPDEDIHYFFEK